jgi:hypothetical protein
MRYQMWHVASSNLMDDFDREDEALDALRANLTPNKHGVTIDVLLIAYDDDGKPLQSIEGEDLARLAFESSIGQARRAA